MSDPRVREYAEQAVAYVERALGIKLEFDSDTLPVLDHYLHTAFADGGDTAEGRPALAPTVGPAIELVLATAGAYFGEVIIRLLGGRWELGEKTADWRVVLPTGLNFSPAGFVAAAIAQADLEDFDSEIAAPPRMMPYVQQALARMGEVTVEEYYSLCGRLDTLEHLHEVLVAVAAQMLGDGADPDGDGEADGEIEREADGDAEADAAGRVN
ncbi:MAG TPA: hypothetical protein VFP84_11580 [Kofleriaceae bacterium]|nr:hypothetical protein [Kofleriaceae bacterium]